MHQFGLSWAGNVLWLKSSQHQLVLLVRIFFFFSSLKQTGGNVQFFSHNPAHPLLTMQLHSAFGDSGVQRRVCEPERSLKQRWRASYRCLVISLNFSLRTARLFSFSKLVTQPTLTQVTSLQASSQTFSTAPSGATKAFIQVRWAIWLYLPCNSRNVSTGKRFGHAASTAGAAP